MRTRHAFLWTVMAVASCGPNPQPSSENIKSVNSGKSTVAFDCSSYLTASQEDRFPMELMALSYVSGHRDAYDRMCTEAARVQRDVVGGADLGGAASAGFLCGSFERMKDLSNRLSQESLRSEMTQFCKQHSGANSTDVARDIVSRSARANVGNQ